MKFKPKTEGGTSGKNFVRLKAGESVHGIFRGEPYDFRQHWVNNKTQLCTGDECELCKAKNKASFRFRLNLIINENKAYVAKIFEQGYQVYDYIRSLADSGYDLEKTVVKITRHGSGPNDTSYVIVPVPGGALDGEKEKAIETLERAKKIIAQKEYLASLHKFFQEGEITKFPIDLGI